MSENISASRNKDHGISGQTGTGATGGSFHATQHGEPAALTQNQGSVTNVQEGSRTPWGAAQWVSHVAPGVVQTSTPGHGGIKLSPERNKEIPSALRVASGWYEEDCEVSIVGMYHPDAFPQYKDKDPDETRAMFDQDVKNYWPDQFEKATGEVLEPGESRQRDEDVWLQEHADDNIVTACSSHDAPEGMVKVATRTPSTGEFKRFIMSSADYTGLQNAADGPGAKALVDPAKFTQISSPPAPVKVPTQRFSTFSEGNTPAARNRIYKDMNARWREPDGRVRNLKDVADAGELSGKSAMVENGKRTYYLRAQPNEGDPATVYKVTKATFDAFAGPDDRSPRTKAYEDLQIAQHNQDHAVWGDDNTALRRRSAEASARHQAEIEKENDATPGV